MIKVIGYIRESTDEQAKEGVSLENQETKIEFDKYVSILKEVEKLADEKMRPLDLQILYMLKNQ